MIKLDPKKGENKTKPKLICPFFLWIDQLEQVGQGDSTKHNKPKKKEERVGHIEREGRPRATCARHALLEWPAGSYIDPIPNEQE